MNVYVQITNQAGTLTHLFFVQVAQEQLILQQQTGFLKALRFKIPFASLQGLVVDDLTGSRRISFYFEGSHFMLYGNGLGVVDYLSRNLCQKVSETKWLLSATSPV